MLSQGTFLAWLLHPQKCSPIYAKCRIRYYTSNKRDTLLYHCSRTICHRRWSFCNTSASWKWILRTSCGTLKLGFGRGKRLSVYGSRVERLKPQWGRNCSLLRIAASYSDIARHCWTRIQNPEKHICNLELDWLCLLCIGDWHYKYVKHLHKLCEGGWICNGWRLSDEGMKTVRWMEERLSRIGPGEMWLFLTLQQTIWSLKNKARHVLIYFSAG